MKLNLAELKSTIESQRDYITTITERHTQEIAGANKILKGLENDYRIALGGFDLEIVQMARNILRVAGPGNFKEKNNTAEQCLEDAIKDASNGFPKIKKQYFGIKQYDGFYQQSDHPYGYGPKHGSIVFSIELRKDFIDREFTTEELSACIYYLANKIFLK